MATDWLSFNKKNRLLRQKTIKTYADAMVKGHWKEDTGETVKFDPDHNLIDGQHRLSAVVKADIPVSLWVAYDVKPESFSVIDSGMKRSHGDVFTIGGIQHGQLLPTIIRYYLRYKEGTLGTDRTGVSTQTLLDAYNENPVFWDECAKNAARWHKSFRPVAPTIWGLLGAVLVELNNDEAMNFLDKLSSGRGITHEGMFAIRDRFVAETVSAQKTSIDYKIALIVKFWNQVRTKKTSKSPRFDPFKEKMPKAI